MELSKDKVGRILAIYSKLMNGYLINKADEAANYNVNERSIQRDIDDIRNFLEQEAVEHGVYNEVIYDRERRGYRLDQIYKMKLSNDEILAICKILLDSRALLKDEMISVLQRLIDCCVPENNRKIVKDLISNESFHYIEPKHGKSFLSDMWNIGQAIQFHQYIKIAYQGIRGSRIKTRKLKPLAIMFSEYYFYLAAFIDDEKVKENLAKFGAIIADGVELTGIAKSEHRNVVKVTNQAWKLNSSVSKNLYVVEDARVDGILIWQDSDGKIYKSLPNSEAKKIYNSLADYLKSKL